MKATITRASAEAAERRLLPSPPGGQGAKRRAGATAAASPHEAPKRSRQQSSSADQVMQADQGQMTATAPCTVPPCVAAVFRTEAFPSPSFNAAGLIAPWRINIVNKAPDDDLLGTVEKIIRAHPGADVCVHYSLKNNYGGNAKVAAARLETFLPKAAASGASSILLVSGGGARRTFDSLAALRHLAGKSASNAGPSGAAAMTTTSSAAAAGSTPQRQLNKASSAPVASRRWPAVYVAFNPYLPDATAAQEEIQRLRDKVATGLVAGVYLQIGDDLERLKAGLKLLADVRATVAGTQARGEQDQQQQQQQQRQQQQQQLDVQQRPNDPLPVLGSVFLPTAAFLARLRFRPWAGVHLSQEYLRDVVGAEAVTRRLLKVYAEYGVVPLVETELRRPEDASWVFSMLSEAYGPKGLEQFAAAAATAPPVAAAQRSMPPGAK